MREFLVEKLAFQGLVSVKTELGVLGQQLGQENIAVFSPLRVSLSLVYCYLAFPVFAVGLVVVLPLHWVKVQQQHMRYDAVAEDIALVSVGLLELS